MAKNSAKRAQIRQSDALPQSSVEPSPVAAAADAPKPVAQSVDEPPRAPDTADRARLVQLLFDNVGRINRALLQQWLTHEDPQVRKLGKVIFYTLLGMGCVLTVAAVLIVVVAFRYQPGALGYAVAGFTGLTAIGNVVVRLRRR
jgi:hypothetical protein